MKDNEEELQRQVESGQFKGLEDADVKAYQQVFRAISKEPDFNLSHAFADKVAGKIIVRHTKRSTIGEYFWLGLGIFVLLAAAGITIGLMQYQFDLGFLKGLSSYKGVLFFGTLFIALLNFVDKKLMRHKHTAV